MAFTVELLVNLPAESFSRLGASMPSEQRWRAASVAEIMIAIRTGRAPFCVVDPCAIRSDLAQALVEAAADAGAVLAFYTPYSKLAVERMLTAVRTMPVDTIFIGAEDERAILRRMVSRGTEGSAPALVIHNLSGNLAHLPMDLATSIAALFGWSTIPSSAEELLRRGGASARTSQDQIRRAGLRSASSLLWGARLAREWHALRSTSRSRNSVSELDHVHDAKTIRRRWRELTGLTPKRAVTELTVHECAARIVTRLRSQVP